MSARSIHAVFESSGARLKPRASMKLLRAFLALTLALVEQYSSPEWMEGR